MSEILQTLFFRTRSAVKSQNTVIPNPLCRLPVTFATSRDVPFSPNSITPTIGIYCVLAFYGSGVVMILCFMQLSVKKRFVYGAIAFIWIVIPTIEITFTAVTTDIIHYYSIVQLLLVVVVLCIL